jgi:hypothetical protein
MKKRLLALVLVGLIVLTVLAAPAATAGTTRTPFEGTAIAIELLSPGRQWFSDGIHHVRDMAELHWTESNDPRFVGYSVVTSSVNFHLAPEPVLVYGPMWGTSRLENDGGYWESTWVGYRGEQGFTEIHLVSRGHGGYEGLQIRAHMVRETPDFTAPLTIQGVIIEPGGD